MDLNDAVGYFLSGVEKIELYWNFYVVTIVAVLGWFIAKSGSFPKQTGALLAIAFSLLTVMNFIGLFGASTLTEAMRLDLVDMLREDPKRLSRSREILTGLSYETRRYIGLSIHVAFDSAILSAIWFSTRGESSAGDA